MVNPLKLKFAPQIVCAAFIAVGAMTGLSCGYRLSGWTWGGPMFWLKVQPDHAIGWAMIGALIVGIVIYSLLAILRSRRLRGSASTSPPSSRKRSTDVTGPTSARRKRERPDSISSHKASQGSGSNLLRA
jgi:hypothetical protein